MHGDPMNAVANLRVRIGNILRMQTLVDRLPIFSAIISTERARGGDRNEHSFAIFRIQQNRVQTHSTGAWLPTRPGSVAAQSRQFLPRLTAVARAEQSGILHPGINGIRIGQRWFEMPDAFEFPRMLRAVVPHMSCDRFTCFRRAVVDEFVALAFWHPVGSSDRLAGGRTWLEPAFATIIGALNDLAEPAAGLGRVKPIRVGRRTFDVINFPAREMRTVHVPLLALAIRCEDEGALPCANQQSYSAHGLNL